MVRVRFVHSWKLTGWDNRVTFPGPRQWVVGQGAELGPYCIACVGGRVEGGAFQMTLSLGPAKAASGPDYVWD